MRGRIAVTVRVCSSSQRKVIEVRGQTVHAMPVLDESGSRGVTALECSTWANWLAAYCHDRRRDHRLAIRCNHEEHPGGWHGHHVPESAVEINTVGSVEGVTA